MGQTYTLFPPNTTIKDFGYEEHHPLRLGQFKKPIVYDGIEVHGVSGSDSDDDFMRHRVPHGHPRTRSDAGTTTATATATAPDGSHQRHNDTNDNDNDNEHEHEDTEPPYASDEINRHAVALFDFAPENDNEVALTEGQAIWISYRHGQGWLVAEDPETGENGLVPEEYVEIHYEEEVFDDMPKPFLPAILQNYGAEEASEEEWVDTDFDNDTETEADALTGQLGHVSLQEPE